MKPIGSSHFSSGYGLAPLQNYYANLQAGGQYDVWRPSAANIRQVEARIQQMIDEYLDIISNGLKQIIPMIRDYNRDNIARLVSNSIKMNNLIPYLYQVEALLAHQLQLDEIPKEYLQILKNSLTNTLENERQNIIASILNGRTFRNADEQRTTAERLYLDFPTYAQTFVNTLYDKFIQFVQRQDDDSKTIVDTQFAEFENAKRMRDQKISEVKKLTSDNMLPTSSVLPSSDDIALTKQKVELEAKTTFVKEDKERRKLEQQLADKGIGYYYRPSLVYKNANIVVPPNIKEKQLPSRETMKDSSESSGTIPNMSANNNINIIPIQNLVVYRKANGQRTKYNQVGNPNYGGAPAFGKK